MGQGGDKAGPHARGAKRAGEPAQAQPGAARRARFDASGRRALFVHGGSPSASEETARKVMERGRRALFSRESGERSAPEAIPKLLEVTCSACGETYHLDLLGFLRCQFPVPMWVPFREYAHWMTCSRCGRRAWSRVRLTLLSQLDKGQAGRGR